MLVDLCWNVVKESWKQRVMLFMMYVDMLGLRFVFFGGCMKRLEVERALFFFPACFGHVF